jgi:hypothetical protein
LWITGKGLAKDRTIKALGETKMKLYYFIRSTGDIGRSYDKAEIDDWKRKAIGNYFDTADEAAEHPLVLFFHASRRSSSLASTSAAPLFPHLIQLSER